MKRKERKKRKLKVIGYWLLAVGFLFIVGCGFRVFGEFRGIGESVWEGEGRVNWVMINDGIWLVSVEPNKKELVVLEVPKDTEIEATRGFGYYRIGAIYQLGKLEGMDGGLIRESVQESLGVPVDGWIRLEDVPLRGRKWKMENGKLQVATTFRNLILAKVSQTNFSRWDLIRLWWETRKVLPHQIKDIQLEEIGALKSKVLIDGSRVWEIDQGKLDIWLQDNFYEPEIREESLTIKVVNVTDHTGLAAQTARIISNMGGRVIEIKNEKLKIKNGKCEVRSEKERSKTFTVRRLMKALRCQFVEEQDGDGRAEVTILVGEDYWRMLNGK